MSENAERSDLEVALAVVSRDVDEWAERTKRLSESLAEAEQRHKFYTMYRDDLRDRLKAALPAPSVPLDQRLVEALRGKNAKQALLYIAEQSQDKTLDTTIARELMMAAGVVSGDATSASKHISVTLSRSDEFKMLGRGKHSLTEEYIERMNNPNNDGRNARIILLRNDAAAEQPGPKPKG